MTPPVKELSVPIQPEKEVVQAASREPKFLKQEESGASTEKEVDLNVTIIKQENSS